MEERNTEENATSSNATELDRKQWHGPYFGSMRLELKSSKEDCEYRDEYPLNKKALQIDMLAIARRKLAWVLDEITANFRKHNIIEFKSPDDDLNLDVFYKTVGYACLYKAQESRVGEIPETEIAITFIREKKAGKAAAEAGGMVSCGTMCSGNLQGGDGQAVVPGTDSGAAGNGVA